MCVYVCSENMFSVLFPDGENIIPAYICRIPALILTSAEGLLMFFSSVSLD